MIERMRILAIGLLVLPCLAAHAAGPVAPSFDAANVEQVWNRAHLESDVAALADLWAEDIVIVVPNMSPLGKGDALAMWEKIPVRFSRYESTVSTSRVEGHVAVVTGAILRARTFGDRSAEERWNFTKVYRWSGEKWRVILFHASTAPPPP